MWFTLLIEAIGSDKNQLHAESVDQVQLELDVIKVLPHSFIFQAALPAGNVFRFLVRESWFPHINIWTMPFVGTFAKLVPQGIGEKRRVFGEILCLTGCQEGPKAFCPFLERVEASHSSFTLNEAFCVILIQNSNEKSQ